MGRLEYLNRLSLGLSAFHPLQAQQQPHEVSLDDINAGTRTDAPIFDGKGRPKSSRAAEHNAAQRFAQNEVLELVNVVERKQQQQATEWSEAPVSMHGRRKHAHLALLADGVRLLLTWYPHSLLDRSLLGIYGPETSFAEILARDIADVSPVSSSGRLSGVLSGLDLYITYAMLSTLCNNGVEALSAELSRLIDLDRYGPTLKAIRLVLAALQHGFELCLVPVLHFAISARLGLIRPRSIYKSGPMLVGYTRLLSSSLSHVDRSLPHTLLALPLLLAIKQGSSHMFTHHRAPRSHEQQRRVLVQPARVHSWIPPISTACRQDRMAIQGLYDEDNLADHARETLESAAGQACRNDWAPQAHKVHSRIPDMAMTILRRLMQLPLDWVVVQLSARAFNIIIGPFDNSGCTVDLPIYHIFEAPNRLDTILAYSSKVGLALGFTLAVEIIVHCAASSMMKAISQGDVRHRHDNR